MTTTEHHEGQTALSFEAPGPGTWERDNSHCPPSATPLYQRLASTTMTATYRDVFARWGAPLDTMEVRFVHGRMFRRLVPLVGADRTGPPPPHAGARLPQACRSLFLTSASLYYARLSRRLDSVQRRSRPA